MSRHHSDRQSRPTFKSGYRPKSVWADIWKHAPDKMRKHITTLSTIRTEKAQERGRLIQAIFNLLPEVPMFPYELRDAFAVEWESCYGEVLDRKQAWSHIRCALRQGMIAKNDEGRYIVRHG